MTEHEAREGMGGTTDYQVGEAHKAPMPTEETRVFVLSERTIEHLENLLAAQGE